MTIDKFRLALDQAKTAQEIYDVIVQQENALEKARLSRPDSMFKRFHLGVCYYPEHWPAARHADDFRRMRDNGFDLVRMGEGAWSYFEPEDGNFRFDLFDRAIDLCRRYDIKVILGTPTYCGPAWIATNYPEVLRWNFQRIPMKHGSRRNFNYTSPKYLELSDRICTALAEHYAGEKQIIGWQLDNEFNCHMDVSYAPSDTIAFRQWLREKYRTLDKLNHAWGTAFWSQTYGDWDQIDLPHPTSAPPNPSQLLDESRFISDRVCRFAQRQAKILRRHNTRWLITHNALFNNVNGPELMKQLDFFSHDQYPLFSEDWPARARHPGSIARACHSRSRFSSSNPAPAGNPPISSARPAPARFACGPGNPSPTAPSCSAFSSGEPARSEPSNIGMA